MKVGHAFADHIKSEKIKRRHFSEGKENVMRASLLTLLLLLAFSALLFRLISLQLFKGSEYRALADSNRIRTETIYAPRGVIFDRNGDPLVFNKPGFRQIENNKTTLLSHEVALERIAKGAGNIGVDSLREYPYKEAFAHVLGYVGQITEEELESPQFSGYGLTDLIGKTGLERKYEGILRGRNGKQLIEVDVMGKPVRTLGRTDPISGQDLTLTVDAGLQTATYEALDGVKRGAVIASTPDGQILAMLSKPSFDPNLFTLDTTYRASESGYQDVSQILSDTENQPLLNRAVEGTYPPGSTFKLITAAAGLENKIIDRNFIVKDTGVIRIGQFSFSNWYFTQYGGTDGDVNVIKAISRSNDIFFYKLAEKINVDRLSETAAKFGVGRRVASEFPGEQTGVLPTQEWKERVIGEQWYTGDTFIYGIGQGYLLTTPLQVNAWTQVVANGGMLYQSRLLKSTRPQVLQNRFLSTETVNLIREGMIQSCSRGGVAYPFFDFKVQSAKLKIDGRNFLRTEAATGSAGTNDWVSIPVACKTGTAEQGGEKDLPHAWITLFAPAYNPEIVVTVLSEASGEGSNEAAPIAKKILETWFTLKR